MSDSKEFKWTDELVAESVHYWLNERPSLGYLHSIPFFKESKQSTPPVQEYEILSFKIKNNHNTVFVKKESGLFGWNGKGIMTEKQMISECHEIHSVKRLSDGEVFSIDNKFTANAGCDLTIKSFAISGNTINVWSKEYGYWQLSQIQKVKPKLPLFTKEQVLKFIEDNL